MKRSELRNIIREELVIAKENLTEASLPKHLTKSTSDFKELLIRIIPSPLKASP